jgi:hypothetical protein
MTDTTILVLTLAGFAVLALSLIYIAADCNELTFLSNDKGGINSDCNELTFLSNDKGGINSIKSQIKKRPSAPKSMKAKRKLK